MENLTSEADFLNGSGQTGAHLLHIADAEGRIRCAITNYGARLVSCMVSDKAGHPTDVALGYATIAAYRRQPEDYMGAVVGRCANRIAGGRFRIDDREYRTTQNEGATTLHGGAHGLHGCLWKITDHTPQSVTLRCQSPDGDEGFPGNLDVEVTYAVSSGGNLAIRYRATTDAPTPVNLSNHAYWNLSGEGSPTIEDHLLTLHADACTPVDAALIPTGEIRSVAGTPFDFRQGAAIGARINDEDAQLRHGKGYDHNWALNSGEASALTLSSPRSGIVMQLFSTAPGLQFYSGNGLDGSHTGKSGRPYGYRSAVVLEPQAFPDAVHHGNFPDVILRPGVAYGRTDVYRFAR